MKLSDLLIALGLIIAVAGGVASLWLDWRALVAGVALGFVVCVIGGGAASRERGDGS